MRNAMTFSAVSAQALHGQLKLGQLAAMTEKQFSVTQAELEHSPVFSLLKTAGVIRLSEFPRARFAAKQFGGYGVKLSSGGGIASLVDGNSEVVGLIQRIGQEDFERWFLKSDDGDADAADACDLTFEQVKQLRDFVDRVYMQAEFESTSPEPDVAPAPVFSAVAGIAIEDGEPVLSFFHREIWKGRYSVDEEKLAGCLSALSPKEARAAKSIVSKLVFLERRKTTLFRLLELLLPAHREYFLSGDPKRRKAMTQRELSAQLEVDPSVLNRLISNKSVQVPWGVEIPLGELVPSGKDIAKGLVCELAEKNPGLSDEKLRLLLEETHQIELSRRSIAQYRKDLGLTGKNR